METKKNRQNFISQIRKIIDDSSIFQVKFLQLISLSQIDFQQLPIGIFMWLYKY